MGMARWLKKKGSTGSIARWVADRWFEGTRGGVSAEKICEAMLDARYVYKLLLRGTAKELPLARIKASPPTTPRDVARLIWDVEIGAGLPDYIRPVEQSECYEILDEILAERGLLIAPTPVAPAAPQKPAAAAESAGLANAQEMVTAASQPAASIQPAPVAGLGPASAWEMVTAAHQSGRATVDAASAAAAAVGFPILSFYGVAMTYVFGTCFPANAHHVVHFMQHKVASWDWASVAPSLVDSVWSTLAPGREDAAQLDRGPLKAYATDVLAAIDGLWFLMKKEDKPRADPSLRRLSEMYQTAVLAMAPGMFEAVTRNAEKREVLMAHVRQRTSELEDGWLMTVLREGRIE